MDLFVGFKNVMVVLILSMIGVYIFSIGVYTLFKNCTMKMKISYLKSINFEKVMYRQSLFGNHDKYRWERDNESITENELEKISLSDLKTIFK